MDIHNIWVRKRNYLALLVSAFGMKFHLVDLRVDPLGGSTLRQNFKSLNSNLAEAFLISDSSSQFLLSF